MGEHRVVYGLLEPYVDHGIENSAELFDLFIRSAVGSNKKDRASELLRRKIGVINRTTAERLVETLESIGELGLHSQILSEMDSSILDSSKIIRSFFSVRLKFSGGMNPLIFLSKLTSRKQESVNLSYFVESWILQEVPHSRAISLIVASRSSTIVKLSCILSIYHSKKEESGVRETLVKIRSSLGNYEITAGNTLLLERAGNIAFSYGEFGTSLELMEILEKSGRTGRGLVSNKIRSLISLGKNDEARIFLFSNRDTLSRVGFLRFLMDLGEIESIDEEMRMIEEEKLSVSEGKKMAEINFRLNRHVEYCDYFRGHIFDGDYSLTDLTRYFHALCKIGEEGRLVQEYWELRRVHSSHPKSRSILAITGYDFNLCDDYVEEVEISFMMEPRDFKNAIFVCNSFLALERIDLAYFFYSKKIDTIINSREGLELGRRIAEAMHDLEINPSDIIFENLSDEPIYSDVKSIEIIIRELGKERGTEEESKLVRRIGVHSHTLGIGGAERQVSLLLRGLSQGKIKSESFGFVTNEIPKGVRYQDSYYPLMEDYEINIFEYNKPLGFYGGKNEDGFSERVLRHISPLKRRRILAMESIFREEGYTIVHTWQDWCNIYGGIAALIAGSEKVILSGRTLPPIMKSRLQARSGRSYQQAYKLLLGKENVSMVHNSYSGRKEYSLWLDQKIDDSSVIHNCVDYGSQKVVRKRKSELQKIDIPEYSLVIGNVGRFSSDKRPWLFLAVAELILSNGRGDGFSPELRDWLIQNCCDYGEIVESAEEFASEITDRVHFVMVGDGPQYHKAIRVVEESEILRERVHLTGFSPNVIDFLNIFDCFLLTSKVEGLPNVIIEAQYCGVPVLTTDAGGSRECIIEGETGKVAEDETVIGIAKELYKILEDESFRKGATRKAKKFAKREFGQKTWTKRMNEIYNEVLK